MNSATNPVTPRFLARDVGEVHSVCVASPELLQQSIDFGHADVAVQEVAVTAQLPQLQQEQRMHDVEQGLCNSRGTPSAGSDHTPVLETE